MADRWLKTDRDKPVDKNHEILWLSTALSVLAKLFILT